MTDLGGYTTATELVKAATGRIATRLGVTLAEIQSSIVDLAGTSMPEANLTKILAHLTDVTDEVRRDGALYFWHETDSGNDPLGPARTPRPRPAGDVPITIEWLTDDIVTVTHGAFLIVTVNHDEEGTAGMRAVLTAVCTLADSFGVPVNVIGTPGV